MQRLPEAARMKVYERAEDLWPALIKQAGLDVPGWWRRVPKQDSYDADLMNELRGRLFPGSTASLKTLLKAAAPPVSAETLLRCFFQVLQPFSMMKRDILEMLAAAGSRKGDDNIKIRFQLNESDDPLDLLLNEFRDQMEFIEKRAVTLSVREWRLNELWKIPKVAEENLPEDFESFPLSSSDEQIRKWIEQSSSTRRFETFPDVWRTDNDELDRRLEVIVDLLQEILTAFRRYGHDYETARREIERIIELDGGRVYDDRGGGPFDPIGFTLRQLYFLESDFWISAVGQWLLKVRLGTARETADASVGETIVSELDALIPQIRHSIAERDEIVRQLTDILNLPIWKKRHAVYAVWIGSQIWRALDKDWQFRFHLDDDVLSFAFSGSHLATLLSSRTDQVLDWWTELRTPAARLPSGHRSKGIQPDYRIRRAPHSAADSDVLIVEVKQYKRSSTGNFTAALMDYAFACKKASVMLANYGPISLQVLNTLPLQYRGRTFALAFVRPDRKDICQRFHEQVKHLIGSVEVADSRSGLVASVGRAELKWEAHPQDLDLHLYSAKAQQGAHVCYSAREFEDSIRLIDDIQNGYGPEILLFQNATGSHRIYVHQYSNDGTLATSGATLTIFADLEGKNKITSFDCPKTGVGRWWAVCTLDLSAGLVRAINRIVENPADVT
jgi:hypothetical protein